jgi:hypothetical protein
MPNVSYRKLRDVALTQSDRGQHTGEDWIIAGVMQTRDAAELAADRLSDVARELRAIHRELARIRKHLEKPQS